MEHTEFTFNDLMERLRNDESFLGSQEERDALCRSLFFVLVEI